MGVSPLDPMPLPCHPAPLSLPSTMGSSVRPKSHPATRNLAAPRSRLWALAGGTVTTDSARRFFCGPVLEPEALANSVGSIARGSVADVRGQIPVCSTGQVDRISPAPERLAVIRDS